ncbi:MAG: hypothetical protein ACKO6K_09395, partial [Chitinophagaceae bacterium]
MKSFFITLIAAVILLPAIAQKNLKQADNLFKNNKFKETLAEIETFLANPANQKNMDAHLLKIRTMVAISRDSVLKTTYPDARPQALDLFHQYIKMRATGTDTSQLNLAVLIKLEPEKRQPLFDLYADYLQEANISFNQGKYLQAAFDFEKCLDIRQDIVKYQFRNLDFDTLLTFYAGTAAQLAERPDLAVKFYTRIAEQKISGDSMYVNAYVFLINHYVSQSDKSSTERVISWGKVAYPNNAFMAKFNYDDYQISYLDYELDQLRKKGDMNEVFKKYDEILTKSDYYLFIYNYAVELVQYALPQGDEKKPEDAPELLKKAFALLKRCAEKEPEYPNTYQLLGSLIVNELDVLREQNKALKVKAAAPGKPLKPEEKKENEEITKKKDAILAQMKGKYDEALVYFLKVDDLLGTKI